ncbi:10 TM acyl transferase domain found in Cas1p-domain-containing protein [Cokeromyces recurvatus]|uniref:10 TM acyl transferase domain found in Cas1p-domain-containing protein n=1 Tax=Cokeromyces recurvatus TaxID=90255 RepID=UPI00221FC603|nr:10 TM acyl transferase domain found in Cas1p-domain-containing protein [Cokeromyces recurvatus]KAI7899668.1 10 TM acyl transferase domain found in Cas1p-domain-containing protein [Cokeromyces recurvatus]
MTVKEKTSIGSVIVRGLISSLLLVIFILSITRYIENPKDNTRCHGMLTEGKWLTEEYKQWQPSGCMSKTYGSSEMKSCLGHRRIIYIGDSIMREQYYAMTQFLHLKKPNQEAIHANQQAYSKSENITIEMWWDPFLNTSRTLHLLQGKESEKPSLLIMGSGVWYMRRLGSNYLSGWKTAMDRIFDSVQVYKIADNLMLSPVEIVEYDLLIPERKATLTFDKITIMNNYLRERSSSLPEHLVTPLVVPFVWNKIVTSSRNQTLDGLHFKEPVTKAQAQLALNYRCNSDQRHLKSTTTSTLFSPLDTTCCSSYSRPAWYQTFFFIYFLCIIPIIVLLVVSISSSSGPMMNMIRILFPSNMQTLASLFIFGLAVLYMYICDRSQLFGKMFKQFDSLTFIVLIFILFTLGIVTLKTNDKKEASNTTTTTSTAINSNFLNRDQTNEWKGWMQLVILVYHFVGASQIPGIYNPVRVLVAAYLFQTGYGHFYFFYKKADFSITRILNVLVRLNLLTLVLAYVMKTNYLFYYFSPLVSFWFIIIWITMRVMSGYNDQSWFILTKMATMSVITGIVIHCPGVLESIFNVLQFLFHIQWNVTEWRFRLSLDAWIVYIGMLCAFITIKLSDHRLLITYPRLSSLSKFISLIASIIGLAWFLWFELKQTKSSYVIYHPYISWIPILSFVIIRNFTSWSQNTYSRFFAFIGKISLETFIGQFHMWLAADTRGILIVLPNANWVIQSRIGWWVNMMISTTFFLFICYYLGQATNLITRSILSGAQKCCKSENKTTSSAKMMDSVPLLPTTHQTEENVLQPFIEKKETTTSKESQCDISDLETEEEEEVNDWEYNMEKKSRCWYRRLFHFFMNNYWIKSFAFLIIMGILNRFCL